MSTDHIMVTTSYSNPRGPYQDKLLDRSHPHEIQPKYSDEQADEPVSREHILRRESGQGNIRFPVQLTTSRISNLTRLIHTLVIWCDHTYIVGSYWSDRRRCSLSLSLIVDTHTRVPGMIFEKRGLSTR